MQREGFVFGQGFAMAQQLLDGREQQRGAVGKLLGDFVRFVECRAFRDHVVDQSPMLRFGSVHPAAGHQKINRYMVGNAAPQFDGARVGQYGDIDFRQCKSGMLIGNNDVGA